MEKQNILLRSLKTAGRRAFPGEHRPTRGLDPGVRNLLAELSRTSWLSLWRNPQGQPPQAKTAVAGRRLRSVHIHGESPCRGVPKIPALIDQRPATTNGHRCNWGHLHCWCAVAATPHRASAAVLRPRQGSLQRVGNAFRQPGEIHGSPRDLNPEPIPIADPICR